MTLRAHINFPWAFLLTWWHRKVEGFLLCFVRISKVRLRRTAYFQVGFGHLKGDHSNPQEACSAVIWESTWRKHQGEMKKTNEMTEGKWRRLPRWPWELNCEGLVSSWRQEPIFSIIFHHTDTWPPNLHI